MENQIKDKYNLKVNFADDISYALFPKPHFYANNLNIFQDDNVLINSKNTRIYISIIIFFKSSSVIIKLSETRTSRNNQPRGCVKTELCNGIR